MSIPTTFYWYGRPASELSREELLKVIDYLAEDQQRLRKELERWMKCGDPIAYLTDGKLRGKSWVG